MYFYCEQENFGFDVMVSKTEAEKYHYGFRFVCVQFDPSKKSGIFEVINGNENPIKVKLIKELKGNDEVSNLNLYDEKLNG